MINNIKNTIKLGVEYIHYFNLIDRLDKTQNINLILGTPVHENLGDHLIVYAEKQYLKGDLNFSNVVEIPIEAYKLFKSKLIKNVSSNATIFINGGGWMGNIWTNDELLLEDIILSFPQNKIVIFPQSIYYDKKMKNYHQILTGSIQTIDNNDKVALCVRDKYSYAVAKQIYPNTEIILVPDITLYLKGSEIFSGSKTSSSRKVGICLRKDREKLRDGTSINECLSYCLGHKLKFVDVSTTRKWRIPSFSREFKLKTLANKYRTCGFIVTDRLHGMIFSYLSSVPCIVFDNATGKISGVYETWLRDCENICMINKDNEKNIENYIDSFLYKARESKELQFDFSELERNIRNGTN